MQSTVNTVTRTWAPPAGVIYTGTYNPFDDCDLFNPAANTKRPGQVQCGADQQPAVRPGDSAHDELRSRSSSTAGTCVRTTGRSRSASSARSSRACRCTPATRAAGSATCMPRATWRDQRRLHALLHPGSGRLPAAERRQLQQCGLYDINRIIAPNNLIFNSSKVGGIEDVYDGFDFDANARLARASFSRAASAWAASASTLQPDRRSQPHADRQRRARHDPRTDDFCDVTRRSSRR